MSKDNTKTLSSEHQKEMIPFVEAFLGALKREVTTEKSMEWFISSLEEPKELHNPK